MLPCLAASGLVGMLMGRMVAGLPDGLLPGLAALVLAGSGCLLAIDARSRGHGGWSAARRGAWACLLLGMSMLFAARASVQAPNPLAGVSAGTEPVLVKVCGIVLDAPARFHPPQEELGNRGFRGESWNTRLELHTVYNGQGRPFPADGLLPLRIDARDPGIRAGEEIQVLGRFHPRGAPVNPGERDRRVGIGSRMISGVLVVTDQRLFRRMPETRSWRSNWLRVRASIRQRLLDAVDGLAGEDPMRKALLAAVFLGAREESSDELRRQFTACGLAHILAISGLHLVVLLVVVTGTLRMLVSAERLRLVLAAVVVLGYASILEPRTSVQRAGITIAVVMFGSAIGASWRPMAVIALVFGIVLWMEPAAMYAPGFQLSFGVTAGLATLAAPCRRRWFGPPDQLGRSRWSIIRTRLADATAAAVVAWLVGMPVVMHHFGRIAFASVPATLCAAIPVMSLLGLGFPALLATAVFPGSAELLAIPVRFIADVLLHLVRWLSDLAPAVAIAPPAVGWTIVAQFGVVATLAAPIRLLRRAGWVLSGLAVAVPLAWGMVPNRAAAFSVTALAVGDGTAVLIRHERTAILFDGGSLSVASVGERIVVPALHAMGIRELDAIVVSHANFDHLSAIPAVLRACAVKRMIVSEHFIEHAAQHPRESAGLLLEFARRRKVELVIGERGDELALGMIRCSILHPVSGESCRSVNDQSIVALFSRIEEPEPAILMCGDAQDEALARVMHRYPELEAEAMELPHHGSWRDIAVAFVEHVNPDHVLQSTGPSRFQLDRWSDVMEGRTRQVTVRDGAVSIALDPSDGRFRRTVVPRRSCRPRRSPAGTRSPSPPGPPDLPRAECSAGCRSSPPGSGTGCESGCRSR